jgi:hypothetical protein
VKDKKNVPNLNNDPLKSIGENTQPKDVKTSKEEVPDWLKGNFSDDISGKAEKEKPKKEEKKQVLTDEKISSTTSIS